MGRSNAYVNVRYEVLKKKFRDTLIIFPSKNKLGFKSFGIDRLILEYLVEKYKNKNKKSNFQLFADYFCS